MLCIIIVTFLLLNPSVHRGEMLVRFHSQTPLNPGVIIVNTAKILRGKTQAAEVNSLKFYLIKT